MRIINTRSYGNLHAVAWLAAGLAAALAWNHPAPAPAQEPAPEIAAEVPKPAYEKRWPDRPFAPASGTCYVCHETQSLKIGRPAREHITSAHFRAGVSCQECHGGDPTMDTTDLAHDPVKGFIGKLDALKMNEKCGSCHGQEVKTFMASKHTHDYEDVRKLNCTTCHGAHDIGARLATFSWPKTCNECHALDDLPKLPPEIMDMMTGKDDMQGRLRKLRFKLDNGPFPGEVMEPYREVRQLSADVVHATRTKNIGGIMATIIEKDKALAAKIDGVAAK